MYTLLDVSGIKNSILKIITRQMLFQIEGEINFKFNPLRLHP